MPLLNILVLFSSNTFSEIHGNRMLCQVHCYQEAGSTTAGSPQGCHTLAQWPRLSVRSQTYTTNMERFIIHLEKQAIKTVIQDDSIFVLKKEQIMSG